MPTTADYAMLTVDAYFGKTRLAETEWEMIDEAMISLTGFQARAYRGSDGSIVISYTGTQGGVDWISTAQSFAGFTPVQFYEALLFFARVKLANLDADITLTGHSLGGALASAVAFVSQVQAEVFDAIPVSGWLSKFLVKNPLPGWTGDSLAQEIMQIEIATSALIANHRILGDIATYNNWPNIDPLDYAGYFGGNVYLDNIDPETNTIIVGDWKSDPDLPQWFGFPSTVFPNSNMAVQMHSQGLIALASQRDSDLKALIDLNPYFLPQLANDWVILGTGWESTFLFHQEMAFDEYLSTDGLTIFDVLEADILTLSSYDEQSPIRSNAYLATALTQFSIEYAASLLRTESTSRDSAFYLQVGEEQLPFLAADLGWVYDSGLSLSDLQSFDTIADFVADAAIGADFIESLNLRGELGSGVFRTLFVAESDDPISGRLTNDADLVVLGEGDNHVATLDGDDLVIGLGGNDIIDGGRGNDRLFGGDGNNTLYGGEGDDALWGAVGSTDFLFGGAGNDILRGGANSADDAFWVFETENNGSLIWSDGVDYLSGGSGADVFYADVFDIILDADADDILFVNGVQLVGQLTPVYKYYDDDPDSWNLMGYCGVLGETYVYDSENRILAIHFAETDYNSDTTFVRYTSIYGPPSTIYIYNYDPGDFGFDFIGYKTYIDQTATLTLTGIAAIDGSLDYIDPFYPELSVPYPRASQQLIDLGDRDVEAYEQGSDTSQLAPLVPTTERDRQAGTDGDDVMTAPSGPAEMSGHDGDDDMTGSAGDDVISGGAGDDLVRESGGRDFVDGGAGQDTLVLAGPAEDYNFFRLSDGSVHVSRKGASDASIRTVNVEQVLAGGVTLSMIDLAGDFGSSGDDTVTGTSASDRLYAGAGDDVIIASAGGDRIDGGEGDDHVVYAKSRLSYDISLAGDGSLRVRDRETGHIDTLLSIEALSFDGGGQMSVAQALAGGATASDDLLVGGDGDDTISGLDGDDNLQGGAGNDWLKGDAGDDTLVGGAGDDVLDGGAGFDRAVFDGPRADYTAQREADGSVVLVSSAGERDYLINIEEVEFTDGVFSLAELAGGYGSSGDDVLNGTAGSDSLYGLAGDDVFHASGGDDHIDGGAGVDTVHLAGSAQDYVFERLAGGAVRVTDTLGRTGTDLLVSVEQIRFADEATPYALAVLAPPLAGDPTRIEGGPGDDVLTGGAGPDLLVGGDGDDVLSGLGGDDYLIGGAGDDRLIWTDGSDVFSGGAGLDTLDLTAATTSVTVDLAAGSVDHGGGVQGRVYSIEAVNGGAGSDILRGDAAANRLVGGIGNDQLYGRAGDDQLEGGSGDDLLDGGEGTDEASFADAGAGVTADLETGQASGAETGLDVLVSIENLRGSVHADVLLGDDGANVIYGLGGDDTLDGRAGDDRLFGGDGDDTLSGGAGDDHLHGEAGSDILLGGDGADHLFGGSGDDRLSGGTGSNVLDGGEGADTADYEDAGGVIVDLTAGYARRTSGTADRDVLISIENVRGGVSADHFVGNASDNVFHGGGGGDTFSFVGPVGNDVIADFDPAKDSLIFSHFGSRQEVLNAAWQDGSDVVVVIDANQSVRLSGLSFADLAASDITIARPPVWLDSQQTNWSMQDAIDLSGQFSRVPDRYVPDSHVLPHMSVGAWYAGGGPEYFSFNGASGARVALSFDWVTGNFWGRITVTDGQGNPVATNIEISPEGYLTETVIDFALPETGLYYIVVEDFSGAAQQGMEYYSLRVMVEGADRSIFGTGLDDGWIEGHGGPNAIYGLAGDDNLIGRGGNDLIDGGEGFDTAHVTGGLADYRFQRQADGSVRMVSISADDGDDHLRSIEGVYFQDDQLWRSMESLAGEHGTEADDSWIEGSIYDDRLFGLGGDDQLIGRAGDDVIDGGDGYDQAVYMGASTDFRVVRNAAGDILVVDTTGDEGTDTLVNMEAVYFAGDSVWSEVASLVSDYGTNGSDAWLEGTAGDDFIYGLDGDDQLVGRGGNDYLDGGAGFDQAVFFGASTDYQVVANSDGTFTVTDTVGNEGVNILKDVEALYFDGDSQWMTIEDAVSGSLSALASVSGPASGASLKSPPAARGGTDLGDFITAGWTGHVAGVDGWLSSGWRFNDHLNFLASRDARTAGTDVGKWAALALTVRAETNVDPLTFPAVPDEAQADYGPQTFPAVPVSTGFSHPGVLPPSEADYGPQTFPAVPVSTGFSYPGVLPPSEADYEPQTFPAVPVSTGLSYPGVLPSSEADYGPQTFPAVPTDPGGYDQSGAPFNIFMQKAWMTENLAKHVLTSAPLHERLPSALEDSSFLSDGQSDTFIDVSGGWSGNDDMWLTDLEPVSAQSPLKDALTPPGGEDLLFRDWHWEFARDHIDLI